MNTDRAREIVRSLADGIDPETGSPFPPDSPYQRADTVRALYAILEAAESGKKTRKPADPEKLHAGGKWTPEEEDRLRAAFHASKPIKEIARDHGRTTGGITSRLVKLGLIEDKPSRRPVQGESSEPAMPRPSPVTAEPNPPSQTDPINPDDCPF